MEISVQIYSGLFETHRDITWKQATGLVYVEKEGYMEHKQAKIVIPERLRAPERGAGINK